MGSLGLAALTCPFFLRIYPAVRLQKSAQRMAFLAVFPQLESVLVMVSANLIAVPPCFLLLVNSLPLPLASFPPCFAMKLGGGKTIGFGVERIWGQVPAP